MSRILKASYVNIDNNNFFSIDNTLNSQNIKINKAEKENYNTQQQEFQSQELEIDSQTIENMKNEILEVAKEQAEQIVENARNEAKSIIQQANLEIEEKANEIYELNKQNGFDEGFEKATSEVQALKDEAEQAILDIKAEKERLENELEPQLINLVLDISQKILTTSFQINPEIISLLIKKGLQNVKEVANIKISVSESQYDFILNNKNQILDIDTEKNNIQIIKDSSLENDDCIIETEFGTIKCGVKEQFNGIKEAFKYILGE